MHCHNGKSRRWYVFPYSFLSSATFFLYSWYWASLFLYAGGSMSHACCCCCSSVGSGGSRARHCLKEALPNPSWKARARCFVASELNYRICQNKGKSLDMKETSLRLRNHTDEWDKYGRSWRVLGQRVSNWTTVKWKKELAYQVVTDSGDCDQQPVCEHKEYTMRQRPRPWEAVIVLGAILVKRDGIDVRDVGPGAYHQNRGL